MDMEKRLENSIDMETGDFSYNMDILETFSEKEVDEYFRYCLKHPKKKTPWHFALEKRWCPMFGGGEFDPYFTIKGMPEYKSPIAVLADKRDLFGKIVPKTIHTIFEYAPYETCKSHIDLVKEYGDFLNAKYGITPKLAVIGKKPSAAVEKHIRQLNIDLTFVVLKEAQPK